MGPRSHHRKKPFSGKAKKQQLHAKREKQRKRGEHVEAAQVETQDAGQDSVQDVEYTVEQLIHLARTSGLRTVFAKESRAAILARKKIQINEMIDRKDPASIYDHVNIAQDSNELGFPVRPPWTKSMSTEVLDEQEENAVAQWLIGIYQSYPAEDLNDFEHNLQVWRQLWRVIEKSQVLVILCDARFPLLNWNQALYHYISRDHGKPVILLLNKIDLIPSSLAQAWQRYFEHRYPNLQVVPLSSQDKQQQTFRNHFFQTLSGCKVPEMTREQVQACVATPSHESLHEHEKQVLVVGVVGEPNTGKSSFLNFMFGKVVVSASKTPGHTKHFQTLFYHEHLCFCDCPGLVFPKVKVPKAMQLLYGASPIAQAREPYSAIRMIAEYCQPPLQEVYQLQIPDDYDLDDVWTPFKLAEAFAIKKRLYLKGGKPDVSRAANFLLRSVLAGEKIVLCFPPPVHSFEGQVDAV